MGVNSTKSNLLRWLTLYLLIGLVALLFVVNLFSPFSSQAVTVKPTPTLSPKFLTKTALALLNATKTAIAAQTALAQSELTAIATNPVSLGTSPVVIHLTKIDEKKLIAKDQTATKNLNDQIQKEISQNAQGHLVALVVVYVGVDSANNQLFQQDAPQVASKIEGILMEQATMSGSSLQKARYQSIIYAGSMQLPDNPSLMLTGSKDLSTADLELYLYSPGQ
jgi:hypothetical protein